MKKTMYVSILEDHTMSMGPIFSRLAMEDLNQQIKELKALVSEYLDIWVTFLRMEGHHTKFPTRWTRIEEVPQVFQYSTNGNYTDLWYQTEILLSNAVKAYIKDPNAAQLVMIFTDGHDNRSSSDVVREMKKQIANLNNNDKFTITARVPVGHRQYFVDKGFDAENVMEWEATEAGFTNASAVNTRSVASHVATYATTGLAKTKSFFKTDATNIGTQDLKKLKDISSEICIFPVTQSESIRPFVEARLGRKMIRGAAYYELKKKETVQPQKLLIIRDKKTKMVYAGDEARGLLGLPSGSNIKVAPGDHGNYDIYVQSTSVNRKLDVGAELIYWEGKKTGLTQTAPIQSQPAQVAPSPKLGEFKHVNVPFTPAHASVIQAVADRAIKNESVAQVAAKKATQKASAKKAPRSRNTVQQKARLWINARAPISRPVRELRNYTSLVGSMGFSKVELANMKEEFCSTFGANNVSMAEFLKASTLGDIIKHVGK